MHPPAKRRPSSTGKAGSHFHMLSIWWIHRAIGRRTSHAWAAHARVLGPCTETRNAPAAELESERSPTSPGARAGPRQGCQQAWDLGRFRVAPARSYAGTAPRCRSHGLRSAAQRGFRPASKARSYRIAGDSSTFRRSAPQDRAQLTSDPGCKQKRAIEETVKTARSLDTCFPHLREFVVFCK